MKISSYLTVSVLSDLCSEILKLRPHNPHFLNSPSFTVFIPSFSIMTSDDESIFRIIGIVCFAGTGVIAGIACYWHRATAGGTCCQRHRT